MSYMDPIHYQNDSEISAIISTVTGGVDGPDESETSVWAQIFVSIITLVNEKILATGKKPVEFLNLNLYQNS
jgi:hypothetical protein